jgi:hypothetical protein
MGILDWFKNRPAQFDPDRVSDEMIRAAADKAITLTNPRLNVLPGCQRRLAPAVETAVEFLRAMVQSLPGARAAVAGNMVQRPRLASVFRCPHGYSCRARTFGQPAYLV